MCRWASPRISRIRRKRENNRSRRKQSNTLRFQINEDRESWSEILPNVRLLVTFEDFLSQLKRSRQTFLSVALLEMRDRQECLSC